MKKTHRQILDKISAYLEQNPDLRFGQALFNLNILQFSSSEPEKTNFTLRDIHADSDQEILDRIKSL